MTEQLLNARSATAPLWRRSLRLLIWVSVGAYLGAAGYMTTFQRSFLYHPAPEWQAPGDHGLAGAERIEIPAADETRLVGWWLPPRQDDKPVFLYFQGNANGLARRAGRFGLLAQDGSGVLALSYRGYGGSGGAPSEAALHADARTILAELSRRVAPTRIVIFGESLGTGVALRLAAEAQVRGVILDSPYLSVMERARASYPWLPVSLLLADQFRSDQLIRQVDEPIFIFHGSEDRVIPVEDSAKLAALGKPGQITRKVYPGEPHVVPLDRGPMPDILGWLVANP
ncbi:alpha/beta hydrolase [Rhabdaerophilum sp.]|uniref:alpha/beta hydrolase n=1 Tax=Rhabdaerophilum sp. TaxID=2717341 RepID=UPI0038D431DA